MQKSQWFTTIRSEGALLPIDLLQRIATPESGTNSSRLDGLNAAAYHLEGERLNEVINQSWNRLRGYWGRFQTTRMKLSMSESGTALTRDRWLLPLFSELDYGRLTPTPAIEIHEKHYPISHRWNYTPLHLVSCKLDLDERPHSKSGILRTSPYGLVQEVVNRDPRYLWGMVSNGLRLRLLRNNVSMMRQSYVEFDFEAMMEGEVYTDFALFWLLCHQSRVEGERPAECWLECWMGEAQQQGIRALDQMYEGVRETIKYLGSGFLSYMNYPANQLLREKLRSGLLSTKDYYRQLLRLVYRLIVLFVAEDRDILFHPEASTDVRERYRNYYSTQRLRHLAQRRSGTRHIDLFYTLHLVIEQLGDVGGCPELGLPALNGFLFSKEATPDLNDCMLANHDLLDAIRALAFTTDGQRRRAIDYKNLGSEELGSVYESLLELHPVLHIDTATFELQSTSGNARKTSGSYYTPTSLISSLLDTALDPVLEEACTQPNAAQAILNLKVCDPACGSGNFLVFAAYRIAKRLAIVQTGEDEPSSHARLHALRQVISSCIYGVDINPMAVELCKVRLWLESIEPGKPLSFLDHRIQCGNSLLGTTPALLSEGIPNRAFEPMDGDNKDTSLTYKKRNKLEREGNQSLWDVESQQHKDQNVLEIQMNSVNTLKDGTFTDIHRKQEEYEEYLNSSTYHSQKLRADAWCATFIQVKQKDEPPPILQEIYKKMGESADPERLLVEQYNMQKTHNEISHLAKQHQFFHWHVAFPHIFRLPRGSEEPENEQAGWSEGFDVVLGNPPYIFGENHQRVKTIFQSVFRLAKGQFDIYWLFIELGLRLIRRGGRFALVVPDTLLARDETQSVRELLLKEGLENICSHGVVFKANVAVITFVVVKESKQPEITSAKFQGNTIYEEGRHTRESFLAEPKRRFLINVPKGDASIFFRLEKGCVPLQTFVKISRGEEIGKKDTSLEGTIPVIAGDNISRYIIQQPTRFLYSIKKNASLYQAPKIVIPKTGNKCIAGLDEVGYVTMQSVYNLHTTTREMAYETLLALLNSHLVRYYLYKTFTSYKDIFPQLNQSTIQSIPINLNIMQAESKLVGLVQSMKCSLQQLRDIDRLCNKEVLTLEVKCLEQEINRVIYDHYELTLEEIDVIESIRI